MKYFVIFSLLLLFSTFTLADVNPVSEESQYEIYLSDVPEGYWPTKAVYNLVKMGVTSGYPDGTFRGKKDISRYEIAAFLSKFADYFYLREKKTHKLLEEFRAELALIKYKREKTAYETQFFGQIRSSARAGSTAPRGAKINYRLKMNLVKRFTPDASLKISLDTVDSGFNTASVQNFAARLVDIESKFKLGALNFKANLGPGAIVHTEKNGFFPSENYTVYIRPKSAIQATASIGKLNLSSAYVARQVETSGKIGVHEFRVKGAYDFGKVAFSLQPSYLFKLSGPRDLLAEVGVNYRPDKKWETDLLFAAGSFSDGQKGMYLRIIERLQDPWNRGTNVTFRFDKVGSKYRIDDLNEYEFIYLNNFNRLILDGTVDLGIKIDQKMSDSFSLNWMGDYVTTGDYKYGVGYAGTYLLWQVGGSYLFSSSLSADAFYRSYHVPSGVAQFSQVVPAVSTLLGVGIKCAF